MMRFCFAWLILLLPAIVAGKGEGPKGPKGAKGPKGPKGPTSPETSVPGPGSELEMRGFLKKFLGSDAAALPEELTPTYQQAFEANLRTLHPPTSQPTGAGSHGKIAASLDKLSQLEVLFVELDTDKTKTLSDVELKPMKDVQRRLFQRKLDKEEKAGLKEDAEGRKETPKKKWKHLTTAKEVQNTFWRSNESYARADVGTSAWGSSCHFDLGDVKELNFFRFGTREDGQALVMYHAMSHGKKFVLKLGRFVDLKREVLVTRRLAACGSTSFARTCGMLSAAWLQDGPGLWRESKAWPKKIALGAEVVEKSIDVLSSDDRDHCTDCKFSPNDAVGSYLKDGSMRAHLELCPRECVVFQVQEWVEGLSLEGLAWPYKKQFVPGHDDTLRQSLGLTPAGEKKMVRDSIDRWMKQAGVVPSPDNFSARTSVLTSLVIGRIFATYLHFHSECGILHDDMHIGNVVLSSEHGDVKIIDYELAVLMGTEPSSVEKHWSKIRSDLKPSALLGDRGTQCDTMFKGCTCEWPWGMGSKAPMVGCNLFGLELNKSKVLLQKLMQDIPELPDKVLGEHAATAKKIMGSKAPVKQEL